MTSWIHFANLVYLASYLVRDILWLRVLTVVAGTALIPYYALNWLPEAIAWNFLFIAINVVQIKLLLAKRLPVNLDDKQQRLYCKAFRALSPREFVKLLDAGQWHRAEAGEQLIEEGQPLDKLIVVYSGQVDVRHGDETVATLGFGQFVGEMSFLTGDDTSASVWTAEEVEYVAWDRARIDKCLDKDPEIRGPFQVLLGADLAHKLKTA